MATETKLPKLTPVCTQTVVHHTFKLCKKDIVEALKRKDLVSRIYFANFDEVREADGSYAAWCVPEPFRAAIIRYVQRRNGHTLKKPKCESCIIEGGPDGLTCTLTLSVQT